MNLLPSLWPGEVDSYDAVKRTCRVRIPGITDGSGTLPEAVFMNALGDRASDTEIRILPNDAVWLMFEGGDPRFPVIAGYRTPRAANPVDWRRWRHANIELTADGQMRLISGAATVMQIGTALTVTAGASITLQAPAITLSGDEITLDGKVTVNGNLGASGTMTNNGVDISSTHRHISSSPGSLNSTPQ